MYIHRHEYSLDEKQVTDHRISPSRPIRPDTETLCGCSNGNRDPEVVLDRIETGKKRYKGNASDPILTAAGLPYAHV